MNFAVNVAARPSLGCGLERSHQPVGMEEVPFSWERPKHSVR